MKKYGIGRLGPLLALVIVALAACASNSVDKASSGSSHSRKNSQPVHSVHNQPLLSIPHVGKMTWSCNASHAIHPAKYSFTLTADRMSATDMVVWADSLVGIAPKKTLQPGHRLTFTGGRAQTLQITQATEPRTLTVHLTIHFKGCSANAKPIVHKTVKTKKNF